MSFHGIVVPLNFAVKNPYTEEDYERFRRWGLNAVHYKDYWGRNIEPDELQPGVYDEDFLDGARVQFDLAKAYGLKPFIGIQNSFHQRGDAWIGWPDVLGGDYINLNQADASGTKGRDRYVALLTMLATRFPDVGISVWDFPYHGEEGVVIQADEMRMTELHAVTLPLLCEEVRKATSAPIIVNPTHQGKLFATRQVTGMYGRVEDYGWPFTNDPNLYYGFNNHAFDYNKIAIRCPPSPWDYDLEVMDWHYEPLRLFMEKYGVKALTVESTDLSIHKAGCDARPIEQSRLDWVRAGFEKMRELDMGWFYFRYNPPTGNFTPIEADGSDTAVAELITEYSPTPITPVWNALVLALGATPLTIIVGTVVSEELRKMGLIP